MQPARSPAPPNDENRELKPRCRRTGAAVGENEGRASTYSQGRRATSVLLLSLENTFAEPTPAVTGPSIALATTQANLPAAPRS